MTPVLSHPADSVAQRPQPGADGEQEPIASRAIAIAIVRAAATPARRERW
jgi:hypothetical protein